jgi:hypothetical protein
MRWVNSSLAVAALAALATGCGNYSTEDIRFLSALPRRTDLHVTVPADAAPPTGALVSRAAVSAACPAIGDATIWTDGKKTSDNLNAGVDWIVGLIDVVRKYPPTKRDTDSRTWGPFVPDDRPGRELRIVISRTYPPDLAGEPRHDYVFEGRWKAVAGPFFPIIQGTFDGPSSAHGNGTVLMDFGNIRRLQMEGPNAPTGTMTIVYNRATEPTTVELSLATGGFGVVQFDYGFAGYADGSGRFDYKIVNALNQGLTAAAYWDSALAGKLQVFWSPDATTPPDPLKSFDQCWDAAACLVYVRDPNNYSGTCASSPCGSAGACATFTVPTPPF